MLFTAKNIWWAMAVTVFVAISACGGGGDGSGKGGQAGGGGTGGAQPLVLGFALPDVYDAEAIPATAQSVVVGDFDDDGTLDIAVVNNGGNNAGVFINNGDGTFQPQATYPTQTNPQVIASGDFNGDNLLDLLVGTGSDFVSYLPNTGTDGKFDTSTDVDLGASLVGIGVADFDDDGDLDGVFPSGTNLKLLDNNGAAAFTAENFSAGVNITDARSAAVADFSGDGIPDVAIADFGGDRVAVWTNSADAADLFPDTNINNTLELPTGSSPQGIAAGDFNQDGLADIVVPNAGTDNVSVFLNLGSGDFSTGTEIDAGDDTFGAAVGDFDDDGNLDFALANFLGNAGAVDSDVAVVLGNGDGTFQPAQYFTVGQANGARGIAVGDFNDDGLPDIVTTNSGVNTISVLLNTSAP